MVDVVFGNDFSVRDWPEEPLEIAGFDAPLTKITVGRIPFWGPVEIHSQATLLIQMELFFSNVNSHENVRELAIEIFEKMRSVIAFVSEAPISFPSSPYILSDGETVEGGKSSATSGSVAVHMRATTPNRLGDMKYHIEKCEGEAKSYYFMFCIAMQSEGIGRYLLLYLILLTHFNDSQKDVDTFIRQEEPGVLQSPRPDKENIRETVYTRLRNEIAHSRSGASQSQTAEEIYTHTSKLISLVKSLIGQI